MRCGSSSGQEALRTIALPDEGSAAPKKPRKARNAGLERGGGSSSGQEAFRTIALPDEGSAAPKNKVGASQNEILESALGQLWAILFRPSRPDLDDLLYSPYSTIPALGLVAFSALHRGEFLQASVFLLLTTVELSAIIHAPQ
jgi:hypothetical protein